MGLTRGKPLIKPAVRKNLVLPNWMNIDAPLAADALLGRFDDADGVFCLCGSFVMRRFELRRWRGRRAVRRRFSR